MKKFNTVGLCTPELHYMVDISGKLEQIGRMIEQGYYFTVSRARQYGKTTTLEMLRRTFSDRYTILDISFERLGEESFENETVFMRDFLEYLFLPAVERNGEAQEELILEIARVLDTKGSLRLARLPFLITRICTLSKKPVVLLIDEVDQASDKKVFLDFLGILRSLYLTRSRTRTFQSVILAGVYDVKNLSLRIRPREEHKYNSPWNIAKDFNVDMSFSPFEIATMLRDYEKDYRTGMDVERLSDLIYEYTSGYPFLVSRICELMDELLPDGQFPDKKSVWTEKGVLHAIKLNLNRNNLLFDDLDKKLNDFPNLNEMIKNMLLKGMEYAYAAGDSNVKLGLMFGFLKVDDSKTVVSNRIFETYLYNKYVSELQYENQLYQAGNAEKNQFLCADGLNMDQIMERFAALYLELYGNQDISFLEEQGRLLFLTFLKPIINGIGNYYIEARTRNQRRTDIIVDYRAKRYIIELKIWRGAKYEEDGLRQLAEYLEYHEQKKGWLLCFQFIKDKRRCIQERICQGRKIMEVIV